MAAIDKDMLRAMNEWRHEHTWSRHGILYVNSRDRALTNATIRKYIRGIAQEDVHGDNHFSFYSAENFRRGMRDYFFQIAEMYMCHPRKEDPIEETIKTIPNTCGWLTLIIGDLETLSAQPEILEELLEFVLKYAVKYARVILIGNGDFHNVLSGCGDVISDLEAGLRALQDPDDKFLKTYLYEQLEKPEVETVTFETAEAERAELDFYWDMLHEQLKHQYFDYGDFKALFRDTWEYLIPRMTEDRVYRQDLWLIENIGKFKEPRGEEKNKAVDGCAPWELEAAAQFAQGLHKAIVNSWGKNDDFSGGVFRFDTRVDDPAEDYGCLHISGSLFSPTEVTRQNLDAKMDRLAEAILRCTYEGDSCAAIRLTDRAERNGEGPDEPARETESVRGFLGALTDGIKKIADDTVNKEPERKVRRYKGGAGTSE